MTRRRRWHPTDRKVATCTGCGLRYYRPHGTCPHCLRFATWGQW